MRRLAPSALTFARMVVGTLESGEYREVVNSDGSTLLSVLYRNGMAIDTCIEPWPRGIARSTLRLCVVHLSR